MYLGVTSNIDQNWCGPNIWCGRGAEVYIHQALAQPLPILTLSPRLFQEIPPPPPPGISMEEADELRQSVERLEEELVELRAELAAKEDANNQLSKWKRK